jgi:hypothetical protein
MPQDVIAIICDCDGTLCPDTSVKLVKELGLDSPEGFWRRSNNLVKEGWDPPLAYLTELLKEPELQGLVALKESKLRAVGKSVAFYPGALDFVPRLRDRISQNLDYKEANVTVE